jgi:cephalosporin hydroxylase
MRSLKAFTLSDTDKGTWHGYDRFYDSMFKDFTPKSLLEIGVKRGNSLAAWKMLFPSCDMYGLDITNKEFENDLIRFSEAEIVIGNSTKIEIADKFQNNYDVIIDDGSHYYKDMMRTFRNFHTKFQKYYVIEDYVYDINLAKQFINSFGYQKVSFYKSRHSDINLQKSVIFRTKSRKIINIDQMLIVIER